MTDPTANPWQVLVSRQVYDNPWISVTEDQVIQPDGQPGIYGRVHFKNIAVGILPIEDGHIYLVGQYRYAVGAYSWEIPEGGCPEGEDPLVAAQRELREETGLTARHWERLGMAHLSNSATDEIAIWYLATGLTAGDHEPEGTEQLQLRRLLVEEAVGMALRDEITDAISKLALLQYALLHPGRPA